MKKFLSVLIILICSFSLLAQNETNIWYFGRNAGLDFNSGTPTILTDGAIFTEEGCSTISDVAGNLLFYTDGITVWNRNHQIMVNGTGLKGNSSSSQSGIIVPSPGNPDIYYVFTAPYQFQDGLYYNLVDMTLDGGLGAITTKNVLLEDIVAEKLTAVQHANGTDIWVVAHDWGNDAFLAYLVTPTGLVTTPVISNTGFSLNFQTSGDDIYYAIGNLKASPNGSKMAICHSGLGAELFDFDDSTGLLTNPVRLMTGTERYYGVEFSPSNEVLYLTIGLTDLYQFDLTVPNIPASIQTITQPDEPLGGLQLAVDGKIYGTHYSGLSVINNPNAIGAACNFVYNAITYPAAVQPRFNLPPFIQSYFLVSFMAENFCLGEPTVFAINTSEPALTVLWDFGDGTTSTLENPGHTYTVSGNYTVSVTVTTASETKTETKDITIFETPVAVPLADLEGCTTQNSYNIDLPLFNSTVLGTQDPTIFTVDYFLSQVDAEANTNALEAIHSFSFGSTPVYIRVSNANNGQCYDTTQFNIIAREAPIVDVITDWTVCDDDTDGQYTFDLSLKYTEIFNGQDETTFEILYFASQADADAGTNVLSVSYTNTLPSEEIFVRFQNSTYPTCFRTGSFMIAVTPGVTANTPTNLEICDDNNDGYSTFNLADTEPEIIGTQSASSLSVSYHTSMADAEGNLNPLPILYTNTVIDNQIIYVRVANASDTNCYATTSFEVNVFNTPQLQTVTDWVVCDNDNDGVFDFNLTENNSEILGGQNASSFSIRYFESLADANLAQNEIIGTYQNTANPQTLFYRLDNNLNTTCFVTSSFDLEVFETLFAIAPSPIIGCDINETGSQTIDLTQKTIEILGNQDPNQLTVAYYASQSDAENNINELNGTSYINTATQETLYARIERNNFESCYALTSLEISINPLPQPVLEERYVICPDSPALVIDGGDFESWSWQDADGTELSTNRIFDVVDLGEYQLTVSQTTNGVSCENSVSFEVLSSGAPESMDVDANGFSDQIVVTVTATGTGPFEYSVDGENYQASNEFKVFPGKYTVYVRDLLECRMLSEELIAIGYQRFFTPNGDGSNEFWNIIGGELYPDSKLYIYDRYGKFLKQISPNSKGWDGTLNGIPLPESDYWFKYEYSDNQLTTGHFTLKR